MRNFLIALLLVLGLGFAVAAPSATRITHALVYDDGTARNTFATRYDGPVRVEFDSSVPDSVRAEVLALLPRINALTEPVASFSISAPLDCPLLRVYANSDGRSNAIRDGFKIGRGNGYSNAWSRDGLIFRSAAWVDLAASGSRWRLTLAQELTQVLGPCADYPDFTPGVLWVDDCAVGWLSFEEQLALTILYQLLQGGEDYPTTLRIVTGVLAVTSLRP